MQVQDSFMSVQGEEQAEARSGHFPPGSQHSDLASPPPSAAKTQLMQLVPLFDEAKAFLNKVETVDKSDARRLVRYQHSYNNHRMFCMVSV